MASAASPRPSLSPNTWQPPRSLALPTVPFPSIPCALSPFSVRHSLILIPPVELPFPLKPSLFLPLPTLIKCHFKSSEQPNKSHISYVPWTKAELWAIINFLKWLRSPLGGWQICHSNSHLPTWFFRFIWFDPQACWWGSGQALDETGLVGISWKGFRIKAPHFWQNARTLAGNLYRAVTVASPKPEDWDELQARTQSWWAVCDYCCRPQMVWIHLNSLEL